MAETIEFKLKIASWDETAYRELADGQKFARAEVALGNPDDTNPDDTGGQGEQSAQGAQSAGREDGISAGRFESLLYYRADGTSSYTSLMQLTGTLGGRTGSFVMQGTGTYDGKVASGQSVVIEGSGTGGLSGLSGTAESVSSHDDYPFMPITLTYDLE
jgi:hypothetical protein